jgi:hypothetical protein
MGHNFLAPDYRLIRLLLMPKTDEIVNETRYMLQLPPNLETEDAYRKVEIPMWHRVKQAGLKLSITTLEEAPDRFIERLLQHLRQTGLDSK